MLDVENLPKTIDSTKKPEEDTRIIIAHLDHYVRLQRSASFRKERCELLMRRKSASKWDATKKSRMVRKLMMAGDEIDQAAQSIEFLKRKLDGPKQRSEGRVE